VYVFAVCNVPSIFYLKWACKQNTFNQESLMSEDNHIFRGNHAPEKTDSDKKPPAKAPVKAAPVQAVVSPPQASPPIPPQVSVTAPAAAQAPLNLNVDPSDLWSLSEQVKARIANLSSSNSAINHELEEQEEKAKRLAQQLKSL
jgi:hypothetical protein